MATIKERIDGVTENVTDGKQDIASAITDKGVSTSSSATFSTMANNIRAIEAGAKDRIVNSGETIYVIAGEKGVIIGESTNEAVGLYSTAEGGNTRAIGDNSHAEGNYTMASGWCSHTSGNYTQTFNEAEFACGRHNKSTSGDTYNSSATLFSVGFGTPPSESSRKNAIEVTMTGALKCNVAWQTGSDRKLKENIKPLENSTLEKVLQLNPVRFTLKDDIEKKEKIGFIAQEVEALYPEYVMVSVDNEGEETRYLDYSQMVLILCKAIQELKQEVEELKSK